MNILCLDLEGVLVPEIWQALARSTGIDKLNATTRDVPIYDELMRLRLDTLEHHDIPMREIVEVIETLEPLPGAIDFMNWARKRFQIAILSDTFYEFAMPLMSKFEFPLLLCHHLVLQNDRIVDYRLRLDDPKTVAVQSFKALNFKVVAAGDSYNDVGMLQAANRGYFFDAPEKVTIDYPEIPTIVGYNELLTALDEYLDEMKAQNDSPAS